MSIYSPLAVDNHHRNEYNNNSRATMTSGSQGNYSTLVLEYLGGGNFLLTSKFSYISSMTNTGASQASYYCGTGLQQLYESERYSTFSQTPHYFSGHSGQCAAASFMSEFMQYIYQFNG